MTGMVLITGAAQRVGLHCALGLQQAGYQVIATYRQPKAGVEQLRQAGVICLALDITPHSDLALQVADLAAAVGNLCQQQQLPLRAVIHNASSWAGEVQTSGDLLAQLSADAAVFDDMFRIHTKLPYLLSRALAPLLTTEQPQAADIIAISDFAVNTGSCNHMAYAASKAALENLVLSLARQLAPQVKVNAIAPALLMFNEGDSAEYRAFTLKKSLMEIEPGPAEVLQSILYLLQSRYITGRVLALDGGRHLKLP